MPKCRPFQRLPVAEAVVPPRKNLHADLMGVPVFPALQDPLEHSLSVSAQAPAPRAALLPFLLQEGLPAQEQEPPVDDRKRCPRLFSSGEHREAAMMPTRASTSPAQRR